MVLPTAFLSRISLVAIDWKLEGKKNEEKILLINLVIRIRDSYFIVDLTDELEAMLR